MKHFWILLSTLPLAACGTFTTLSQDDREIAANLKRQETNCQTVPRIYSGVSYNLCRMNSNKQSIYFDWLLGFYLADSVASAATDTLALPYTVYSQNRHGSLKVNQQ